MLLYSGLHTDIGNMSKVLIIDDEADIRDLLEDIIKDQGYKTDTASCASEAISLVNSDTYSTIVLDIWLEGSDMDGIGVLKTIRKLSPNTPVIMISGHGNIETAVGAIKLGAYDFIEKPFKSEKLQIMLDHAVSSYNLKTQNQVLLENSITDTYAVLGASSRIKNTLKEAKNLGPSNCRVLIEGQDELTNMAVAHNIHLHSQRSNNLFYVVKSSQITGYVTEKFLGSENNAGFLNICNEGTIYIDEIMTLDTKDQADLLSILQNNSYNCRFIAATRYTDIDKALENGNLDKSLYFRLKVGHINTPQLSDRKEDITQVANSYLKKCNKDLSFSDDALKTLRQQPWSGGVLELRNLVERLAITYKDTLIIDQKHIKAATTQIESNTNNTDWLQEAMDKPIKEAREIFEEHYINHNIKNTDGNLSKAAKQIGMDRTALHRKIKNLAS